MTTVRHLLRDDDLSPAEQRAILAKAARIKAHPFSDRTLVGLDEVREHLAGRVSVLVGHSGVGKSTLVNALVPGADRTVGRVNDVTGRGRHTSTSAVALRLPHDPGWVVDTPGVRQLALWDTRPEEVEGYFPEFRPFVPLCAFPDCTHTHETGCAIKQAVARQRISPRRYHSYLGMFKGDEA